MFTSISGIAVTPGEHIIIKEAGRIYRYRVGQANTSDKNYYPLVLQNDPSHVKPSQPHRRQKPKVHMQRRPAKRQLGADGLPKKKGKELPRRPRQELY